jgi:hypothetical protein
MSLLDRLSTLVDWFDFLQMSNRNHVVDGNFDQWTASSGAVSNSTYGYIASALFKSYAGAGGAATVSQQSFTPGSAQTSMNKAAQYYLQYQQTTAHTGSPGILGGSNSAAVIYQNIENVWTLEGESSTLSMWLWCASGTVQISNICAQQYFGTGGSPSSANAINTAVNWTVTTTPQKFSVRIDWPSISGKTVGTTTATSVIQIGLFLPSGATFVLNTTQWQLEQCSSQAPATGRPTAFEYRGAQAELARAQRYYEVSTPDSVLWQGNGSSGSNYNAIGMYKVVKRANATVTFTLQGSSGFGSPSVVGQGFDHCQIGATASSTANGIYFQGGYTADARL